MSNDDKNLIIVTYPCFFSHSNAWIFFRVSASMSSVCFFFFVCLVVTQSAQLHLGLLVQSEPGGEGAPWCGGVVAEGEPRCRFPACAPGTSAAPV